MGYSQYSAVRKLGANGLLDKLVGSARVIKIYILYTNKLLYLRYLLWINVGCSLVHNQYFIVP